MRHADDFTHFVEARWAQFVRSAALLGWSLHDAQDLVQETLIRSLLSWDKVTGADDPNAYVYRILFNLHSDKRRRKWWGEKPSGVVADSFAGIDSGENELTRFETANAMRQALAELSDGQRAVVVLRFYSEMSEANIATILGIAPGTVKSRLSRALRTLAASEHLQECHDGKNS